MSLGIFVLLGFVGLAVDLGIVRNTKRQMQTAADAGAVAAAQAYSGNGNYTAATTAAQAAATQNGFTNGSGTTLSANHVSVVAAAPVSPSAYTSDSSAVQVTVSQTQPTYFLRLLGVASINVAASAVALPKTNGCIYSLDPTDSASISMTGNITVSSACGILVDSSSSSGLKVTGNINVTDPSTGVVGNYSATGNVSFSPTPQTGVSSFSDPLSNLTAPTVPTCTQAAQTNSGVLSVSSSTTLSSPNIYKNGVSLSGNYGTVTFDAGNWGNGISASGNGSLVLNPGQYQNGGGTGASLSVGGNSTVTMNTGQYTFCGPVSLSGNTATATLSPGFYYGGISLNGNQAVVFNPGLYILGGGGLQVNGNSSLSGTGVTFYNTTGLGGYKGIILNGNVQNNFTAPTSSSGGAIEGVLFFQDRSIPTSGQASIINGNSASTFDGSIYFPTTDITFNGNSSTNGYTILVAYKITWNGNSSVKNNYTSLAHGSPLAGVSSGMSLVE